MFGRLFKINKKQAPPIPNIPVGRYSDNNKTVEQSNDWAQAENLFKEKKFLESIEHFFKYLRDDFEDNVIYQKTTTGFNFQIYQGSKLIKGSGDSLQMHARTTLAEMPKHSVPVMRRLLEHNYLLYYSRYSLDEKKLVMQFDSEIATASPNKLYYALKELCNTADKQDDLLISDFDLLEMADTEHVVPVSSDIKKMKYGFMHKWLEETINKVEDLDKEKFSGAISFLLLAVIFKIDYLIAPEGMLMYDLEKIQAIYFKKDNLSAFEKNRLMLEGLKKFQSHPEENFNKSLFKSKSTFSIRQPKNQQLVKDAILAANKNINWYKENNHTDIATMIPEYGISFCNYAYSLPKPLIDLYKIFMQVNYPEYFSAIGFTYNYYDVNTQRLNASKIEEDIQQVVKLWKPKFTKLEFSTSALKYESLLAFNLSFTNAFAEIDPEN